MTIVFAFALWAGWDKPYWAGLSVAFISLSTVGHSLNKGVKRMFGTLLGFVVSLTIIMLFVQERWWFIVVFSIWLGFCTYRYSSSQSYFWFIAGLVTAIICFDAELLILNVYKDSKPDAHEFEIKMKKEKEFATLQMKLLAAAEQRAKISHIGEFYDLLRGMEIFEPLTDNDVRDLSAMLKMKRYGAHKIIVNKGDRGTHLYIVLSGNVALVRDGNEVLAELGAGEIFGEMSLLSGEPVMTSVYSRSEVRLATLSAKDFKHVLNRYPVLQVFFYRTLVNRAQVNSMRSGKISSGMTGELEEINSVELFQLINSGGKTGKVDLLFSNERAIILFNEGEIVHAHYGVLEGKEALFALLAKNKGSFTYTSGLSDADKDLPVIGGFMGLIMEGLRRIDEEE